MNREFIREARRRLAAWQRGERDTQESAGPISFGGPIRLAPQETHMPRRRIIRNRLPVQRERLLEAERQRLGGLDAVAAFREAYREPRFGKVESASASAEAPLLRRRARTADDDEVSGATLRSDLKRKLALRDVMPKADEDEGATFGMGRGYRFHTDEEFADEQEAREIKLGAEDEARRAIERAGEDEDEMARLRDRQREQERRADERDEATREYEKRYRGREDDEEDEQGLPSAPAMPAGFEDEDLIDELFGRGDDDDSDDDRCDHDDDETCERCSEDDEDEGRHPAEVRPGGRATSNPLRGRRRTATRGGLKYTHAAGEETEALDEFNAQYRKSSDAEPSVARSKGLAEDEIDSRKPNDRPAHSWRTQQPGIPPRGVTGNKDKRLGESDAVNTFRRCYRETK